MGNGRESDMADDDLEVDRICYLTPSIVFMVLDCVVFHIVLVSVVLIKVVLVVR